MGEICAQREYEKSDFVLALEATQERVRHPFGARPLEEAFERAQERPLVLKHPKLAQAVLPTAIAGVALELQLQQGDKPIILPVEPLRRLFHQRKLIVGGALRQLVKCGLLSVTNAAYYRGKAREFRFVAAEGRDFERSESEIALAAERGGGPMRIGPTCNSR